MMVFAVLNFLNDSLIRFEGVCCGNRISGGAHEA